LRVVLMHNPTAGDESHDKEGLLQALDAAGHDVVWQSTKEDGWERALDSAFDLVAVAGGDGTVRKVFKRLVGTGRPVTLVPVGSANNIATALGFVDDVEQLARGWEGGRRRPYDIGVFASQGRTDLFVESVGGGIFADLLARAEEEDDDVGGEEGVRRGLQMLRETIEAAEALPWTLAVDGDELSAELLGVEVINVSVTGPNIPLAPEADPGDGLLDLVMIGPEDRDALITYVDGRLADRNGTPPRLAVRRSHHIALGPPGGAPLRIDDELLSSERGSSAPGTARLGLRVELVVPALEVERA
jgi:diacylglycerol kinase (ATP)